MRERGNQIIGGDNEGVSTNFEPPGSCQPRHIPCTSPLACSRRVFDDLSRVFLFLRSCPTSTRLFTPPHEENAPCQRMMTISSRPNGSEPRMYLVKQPLVSTEQICAVPLLPQRLSLVGVSSPSPPRHPFLSTSRVCTRYRPLYSTLFLMLWPPAHFPPRTQAPCLRF